MLFVLGWAHEVVRPARAVDRADRRRRRARRRVPPAVGRAWRCSPCARPGAPNARPRSAPTPTSRSAPWSPSRRPSRTPGTPRRNDRYRYMSPQVETLLGVHGRGATSPRTGPRRSTPMIAQRVEEISRAADRDGDDLPGGVPDHPARRPGALDPRRVALLRPRRDGPAHARAGRDVRHHRAQGGRRPGGRTPRSGTARSWSGSRRSSYAWDSVVRTRGRRPRSTSARRSSGSSGSRRRRGSRTRRRGRRTCTPTTRHGSPRRGASRPTPARRSPRSTACGPRPASGSGSATRRPRSDRAPTADSSTRG